MPTFDTAGPISATIDVVVGDVRISAGDGAAAVIDVRPSDASNDEDVKAAEQTRVEFADENLLVKAPKLRSVAARAAPADRSTSRSSCRPARRCAPPAR